MDDMQQTPPDDISEEELRAAYEEQLKRVRVEDVLVQTLVSLINLGGRKAGLAPGTEDELDLGQLKQAIDAARAILPMVEEVLGPDAKQLRDVLAQLQMAYAQQAPAGAEPSAEEPESPEGPGPAQSSGRLWVPGQ
jgi:hypothetical protein